MSESMEHKCPACSANLPYNPERQCWHCDYCGNDYTLEQIMEGETEIAGDNSEETMNVDVYSCPNCGAEIITDENTTATFCVYCRSTAIMKDRLKGVLRPTRVIPFSTTKDQAKEAFRKCRKGKLFAPKDFSDEKNINDISGVYIPFWLYDCDTNSSISGEGENVTSWTRGDYRYTKTDTYKVSRKGKMSFNKVPVDGSEKFEDDIMDSIEPFNYESFENFSPSYLSGFLAEKYDVSAKDGEDRAKLRIKNTAEQVLKNDIIGYSTVSISNSSTNFNFGKNDYVLLPVWMLNINYKGKMRKFAMNGQTGKLIGDIPVALGKLFAYWFAFFAGTFAVSALVMYIFMLL